MVPPVSQACALFTLVKVLFSLKCFFMTEKWKKWLLITKIFCKMIKVQYQYLRNQKLRWGSNWRFVQELEPKSLFLGAPGKRLPWLTFPSFQYPFQIQTYGLHPFFGCHCFSLFIMHHWYLHATTRKQAALNDPNQLRWFCKIFYSEIFLRCFSKIFLGEIFDAGKMTWAMVLPFWCSRGKKKLAVINNSHFLSSHCAKSQF